MIFSRCDVRDAYSTVPLHPNSKIHTAFTTPMDLGEWHTKKWEYHTKKKSFFYRGSKKSREWHTKNLKIQDLAEISYKNKKKPHKS